VNHEQNRNDGLAGSDSRGVAPGRRIGMFLAGVLGTFVRLHRLGEVIQPPFQMKLELSGREPDLLFVAHEHLDRLRETYPSYTKSARPGRF